VKLPPPWSELCRKVLGSVRAGALGSGLQPLLQPVVIDHSGSYAEDDPGRLVGCGPVNLSAHMAVCVAGAPIGDADRSRYRHPATAVFASFDNGVHADEV
jgi:hypothetical protein